MKLKTNLAHQLLFLIIVIISIIVISLGFILPKNLLPIYENNIYSYLIKFLFKQYGTTSFFKVFDKISFDIEVSYHKNFSIS